MCRKSIQMIIPNGNYEDALDAVELDTGADALDAGAPVAGAALDVR